MRPYKGYNPEGIEDPKTRAAVVAMHDFLKQLNQTLGPSTGVERGTTIIRGPGWENPGSGVTDHGLLSGLLDDDHTQYAKLTGRTGGQYLIGGTATTDHLFLQPSTGTSAGNSAIVIQSTQNTTTDKVFRIRDSNLNEVCTINSGGGLSITDPTNYSSGSPIMIDVNARTAANGSISIRSRSNSVQAWAVALNGTNIFNNGSMTVSTAAPAGAGLVVGQWLAAGVTKGPAWMVGNVAQVDISGLTATRTYTFPDSSGTVVLGGGGSSFIIENRTSDPATPATGQIWIRTDL